MRGAVLLTEQHGLCRREDEEQFGSIEVFIQMLTLRAGRAMGKSGRRKVHISVEKSCFFSM
jgi:hypothetical protein